MMGRLSNRARMLNVSPESTTDAQTGFVDSTYEEIGLQTSYTARERGICVGSKKIGAVHSSV